MCLSYFHILIFCTWYNYTHIHANLLGWYISINSRMSYGPLLRKNRLKWGSWRSKEREFAIIVGLNLVGWYISIRSRMSSNMSAIAPLRAELCCVKICWNEVRDVLGREFTIIFGLNLVGWYISISSRMSSKMSAIAQLRAGFIWPLVACKRAEVTFVTL